jgi:lipopolysaccharide export system permease protein
VIDVSEKTDEMVRSRLGVKRIILEYYIGFIPHIIALLFPLFVFIAVIYFTSKMAVQSEIIAMIAGRLEIFSLFIVFSLGFWKE